MSTFRFACRIAASTLLTVIVLGFQTGCWSYACVVEGTLIATPTGPRPVETIAVGDVVLTIGATDELEPGVVQGVREASAAKHLRLSLADGGVLRVTGEHPIMTDRGWRKAKTLRAGSLVRKREGFVTLVSVDTVREQTTVFDLDVEPNSNYIASGVLVHNKTIIPPPSRSDMLGEWMTAYGGYGLSLWVLEEDGTGKWANASLRSWDNSSGWIFTGEISNWELSGYDISVTLVEERFESSREKVFTGWASISRLVGTFDPPQTSSDEKTYMHRADATESVLAMLRTVVASGDPAPTRQMTTNWIRDNGEVVHKDEFTVGQAPLVIVSGYTGTLGLRVFDLATSDPLLKFYGGIPPFVGYYRAIPDLPVGTYRIELEIDGQVVETSEFSIVP